MQNKKKKLSFKIIKLEGIKIEKILIISLCICFALLILSQVLMINPSARLFLTQEEKIEGAFFEKSDELYKKGSLILELQNHDKMEELWVLINGEKTANFKSKQMNISVKDADLIEIDGTKAENIARIKIISYSKNIGLLINNSVLEVDKNIAVLTRVKVK